jgi:hypothetical protein
MDTCPKAYAVRFRVDGAVSVADRQGTRQLQPDETGWYTVEICSNEVVLVMTENP